MANFAVAASQETIERANRIMELYAREGEKKEEVLLRILDIAENNSVRGTHPELEPILASVDTTVATLIKQINGVVAGQDGQMQDLKGRLDAALEEKRKALDEAAKILSDARELKAEAEEKVKTAEETASKAIREIDAAQKRAEEKEKYAQEVEKRCKAELQASLTAKDLEIAVLKTKLEAAEQRIADLKGM